MVQTSSEGPGKRWCNETIMAVTFIIAYFTWFQQTENAAKALNYSLSYTG